MEIEQIFRGIGKKMIIDFEEISAQVTHNGAKGRIRERKIICDYLDKYLPGNIGVGNGEIIASNGEISSETDIVLYDKFSTPYLLKEEAYQIFPVECVYGVIEVKSHLGQRELEDAAEKIRVAKSLPKIAFEKQIGPIARSSKLYGKDWPYFPMVGFVIAYDSIELDSLAHKLRDLQKTTAPEHRIDSIWILKKGMIVPLDLNSKMIELSPSPTTSSVPCASDNPLLLLTVQLQTLMTSAWMTPLRIKQYLPNATYGTINHSFEV